jgi:DmsE family decaheme c-type cytochrome
MRPYAMGGLTLLIFLGLSLGAAVVSPTEAQAQEVMSCGDCHELAQTFTANPHARGHVTDGTVPNQVCETCHGDGTAHMEEGGDPSLIAVPRGFEGAEQTCLTCHDVTTHRRSHRTGAHANSPAVNCLSCHSIHHAQPSTPRLLVKPELALCTTCHGPQASSFRNKPFAHRIGRGGMGCSSCHEPHGRPGRENIRETAAGEIACLSCHASVRGPHVFPHGALATGDCMTCHEPHGSNNPKQLKRATVMQLCLECHSAVTHDTLGSQPPSFHNLNSPRYRNCTTCHVAVHGSNRSPSLMK